MVSVDMLIGSPLAAMLSLTTTDALEIFKVYRTTYYNWRNSAQKENGRKFMLAQEDLQIKDKLIEIIEGIGYVPGSRTFYLKLWHGHLFRNALDIGLPYTVCATTASPAAEAWAAWQQAKSRRVQCKGSFVA